MGTNESAQLPHHAFLAKTLLRDVAESRGAKEIISVQEDATVESVIALFKEKDIRAAPVVGSDGSSIGIVNIWDIVCFTVFGVVEFSSANAEHIAEVNYSRLDTKISSLLGVSKESELMWEYRDTEVLHEVMDALSKGVHRVLVHGASSDSFLSQMDVLRFLHAHRGDLGEALLKSSVAGLRMIRDEGKIISISDSHSALDGLRRLVQHDVSAVAVTDDSGALTANLSGSDIRGVDRASLEALTKPVRVFLEATSAGALAPITCLPSTPLNDIVDLMVSKHVHRVWVVDEAKKPVGVVTVSDVLYKFSPYGLSFTIEDV